MDKEGLKAELLSVYEKELDVLLEEIEESENFSLFEQEVLKHLNRSGKETTEVVQKYKNFFP